MVEVVSCPKYLGVHIANNLTWTCNTGSIVKKSPLRSLLVEETEEGWTGHYNPHFLLQVCVEEYPHILHHRVIWQLDGCTERWALQQVITSAQLIIGCSPPTIKDIYISRGKGEAPCIMKDATSPATKMLTHLSSGRMK